jgi:dTDP-4-dehydrorhamnose reductase
VRSLIIGARGLVGLALKKCIPDALEGVHDEEVVKKGQVHTDITKYETLMKVFADHRPTMVYLPAAIAHVDKCEDLSTNVTNVRGTITVLRLCEQFDAKLIYFSSSYVFDGAAKSPYLTTDVANPINNYGRQKKSVEDTILRSDAKFLIIRTVGVFGEERRKKNFAKQVISGVFAGRKVFAPNDQWMNPILANDLASITVRLAEKENGLFHVAGDECVTKFEFARRVAKFFNLDHLVFGLTSEEMKQRAPRPKMACLGCGAIPAPSFTDGMLRFLTMEYNR